MNEKFLGCELISLGHLIKREKDRTDDIVKKKVLGNESYLLCSDLSIIKFLVDNSSKEIYQKDIERYFSLTAPSVSNKLRTLEKNGLINRVYSKKDTRLKQVILTDQAIVVDEKMRSEVYKFEAILKNDLTEDEITLMHQLIDKIKTQFE